MGSSSSINQEKFKDNKIKNIAEENQLQKLQTISDPTFDEIQIYKLNQQGSPSSNQQQQSDDQFVAVKQRVIEEKSQFNIMQREADLRLEQSHPNLLQLLGYKFQSNNEICGSTNVSFLYYEYYTHNLDIEITRRHKRAQYFQENEIWYLLDSLCQIGYFFQQNKISHGDIRPINVYLNSQGETKLADHNMVNQQKNGYIKTIMGSTTTNLSPELLEALQMKKNEPEHNQYKSDVFSLGLTILEAATLLSSQTVYNWENLSIKYSQIQELLERARIRYSSQLINVIELMLEENYDIRPDFEILIEKEMTIKNDNVLQENNNKLNLAQQSTHQPQYYEYSPSKNTLESNRNTSIIFTQSSPSKQYSQFSQTPIKEQYSSLNNQQQYVNISQGPYVPQQYQQQQQQNNNIIQQQQQQPNNSYINNTSQNNGSSYYNQQYNYTLPSRDQTPQKEYYLNDQQPLVQQQQLPQQNFPSYKILYRNNQQDEIIQNQSNMNFVKNRQQQQQQQQQIQQQSRYLYKQ